MIDALAYTVVALAGVGVIWGIVTAIANKPPGKAQLLYAAGLEAVTVVQSIIAVAKIIGGFRPVELAFQAPAIQEGVEVSAIERLHRGAHDLHVLLRHRPRSIPQAQESA